MDLPDLLKLCKIEIHIHGPVYVGQAKTVPAFVPSAFQKGILKALAGVALRTDALCAAVKSDHPRLFRKGGIKELQAHGLVDHHESIGYYRPDEPPPDLAFGD